MNTLVTYNPHPLGFSTAQKLWEGLPKGRQVGTDMEAHIILHDEVFTAVEGRIKHPNVLHIVVAQRKPKKLPRGLFWVYPDRQAFWNLVQTLQPGD